jgi:hypothetical protein
MTEISKTGYKIRYTFVVLRVESVIRRLPNSLFREESVAGHMGVNRIKGWGKVTTKASIVGKDGIWRQPKCICSSGAFKVYDNLWEGRNQMIPIQ